MKRFIIMLALFLAALPITAQPNPDTLWNATLGCPGQILNNNYREAPLVPVTFQYGGSDNGFAIGTCTFDLYVDGQRKLYVNTGTTGVTFTITLSAGTHQFDYVGKSCTPHNTTGGFRSNYTDSAGVHPIASPYYSAIISGLFTVAWPP